MSSGSPPAAVAVVRVSGRAAGAALRALTPSPMPPRTPSLRVLRDPASGEPLDRALCLFFPGPTSATGEDLAELHLHGGRAVVEGVLAALGTIAGLRMAEPGEFTRRAFANGRMDLTEVEGLADLLAAETQAQRRQAQRLAEGGLSREVDRWRERILGFASAVEAAIDYDDDREAALNEAALRAGLTAAAGELHRLLAAPPAERLRDGIRVVLAGPPNAGKSSLFNALVGREAAIVSDIAGTTRDRIEAPVQIGGVPFLLTDTAGLRETDDAVERLGVDRAASAVAEADICLWLGDPAAVPAGNTLRVAAKSDLGMTVEGADIRVSAHSGEGMADLTTALVHRASAILPAPGALALNVRQRDLLLECVTCMTAAAGQDDLLLIAEELRGAIAGFDRLTGRAGIDDLLSSLFGRFCLGK